MQSFSASNKGTLYIVATPIGNLRDITLRAIDTLQSVFAILAEDTRHAAPFLSSLNIKKPLYSLHDHNEKQKYAQVLEALCQGKSFALISDAGTPLISDPGFLLVKHAREEGIPVIPIPGCCALIAALSAAGIPCNTFSFYGFLSAKTTTRKEELQTIQKRHETAIIYESKHRIAQTVTDIGIVFGQEFRFVLAKELTKVFETFLHTTAKEMLVWLQVAGHGKGEFVLLLPVPPPLDMIEAALPILHILLQECSIKQAVQIASKITQCPKNILYKAALAYKPIQPTTEN